MTPLPVARILSRRSDPELPYAVVVVHCPYCHSGHSHGAPDAYDNGRRASHCHQGDYRISDHAARNAWATRVNDLSGAQRHSDPREPE